jgi:hypothetical protein
MNPLPSSKRPFRHPVPAEAVDYFCHPRAGHALEKPAWGRDSNLYASNGWVAVRFFGFPASMGTGPQTVVDRLQRLRWHSATYEDPKAWRLMDDCTLDIFREGLFEMWKDERGAYRVDPPARINHGTLVPVVSLQLISRLPRCEVYTTVDREMPVPFRFRGGEGLIARLSHAQEAAAGPEVCHIFPKRTDRF